MKRIVAVAALCLIALSASAQEPPDFFQKTLPANAIGPILQGYGALQGKDAALEPKTRELIALGVAAQIPCAYCVHGHTATLKKLGATEAEIREAVATAGYVRLLSTALHGASYDLSRFKSEIDSMMNK